MIYKFDKRILDNYIKKIKPDEEFYGYILPDGSLYKVKDHKISNKVTSFSTSIQILAGMHEENYENEKKSYLDFLKKDYPFLSDPVIKMIMNYFDRVSYQEACAFTSFMNENGIELDDILVGFFKCHKISRINKEILTGVIDFNVFYNYMMEGFIIKNAPRLIYSDNSFKLIDKEYLNNDYLYNEIEKIKDDSYFGEEHLFHK